MVEDNFFSWESQTYEDAFAKAKHHFRLKSSSRYDRLVLDTLEKRLVLAGNVLQ
jgi:hypothetical protein